jgi:hypothetical protein
MIKQGNDGNQWVSMPDKNNNYRWTNASSSEIGREIEREIGREIEREIGREIEREIKDETDHYDLTKFKDFSIRRNNSILVPRSGETQECILYSNGDLKFKISSEYIQSADGLEIDVNLNSLNNLEFETTDYKEIKYFDLSFDIKDVRYTLMFNISTKNEGTNDVEAIIKKNIKISSDRSRILDDQLEEIHDHHYGDLILFTPELLKYMKKGQRYYIVFGQNWDEDYDGKYNIGVFEYDGSGKEENDPMNLLHLHGTFWINNDDSADSDQESKGTKYPENQDNPFSIISSIDGDYFGTGTGYDPVHLITKFRKGFKPNNKISNVTLFSK